MGFTYGGQGAWVPGSYYDAPGGAGGGPSATSFDACADTDAERLLFGNGGQLGATGGCADGGDGGSSLGDGCGVSGAGQAGGGVIIVLTDTLTAASGAQMTANGGLGGSGGQGEDASAVSGAGGGGGGDGGDGAHGGRVLIVSDAWSDGADLLYAEAAAGDGGVGGSGGRGSNHMGSFTLRAGPGEDGNDGSTSLYGGGGGGGGQDGTVGEDGQVLVWGSWLYTASFPHSADPVFTMAFYGGIECFVEL